MLNYDDLLHMPSAISHSTLGVPSGEHWIHQLVEKRTLLSLLPNLGASFVASSGRGTLPTL
jgi:hypothetical protein